MAKLTAPNGVAVEVSDEKAKRLLDQGYAAETKASAKKPASSNSEK